MIDLTCETRISLEEAARMLGVTIATVYSWRKRTDRRLETAKAGGKRFTTIEAVQRFIKQDEPGDGAGAKDIPSGSRISHAEVERQLQELGGF